MPAAVAWRGATMDAGTAISSMPSAIILVIWTAASIFIRSLAVCHQRSLPGMTRAEVTTRSPRATCTYLCSPAAMSASAEFGSPWLPVERMTWRSGGSAINPSSGTRTPAGTRR